MAEEAMVLPEELENEAAHNRDIAARVRRMAGNLTLGSDRKQIERYADDLEHHAADLEAQARALRPIPPGAPVLTWQQQQDKQQQAAEEGEAERRERRH
jgi:hypothetical protein